MVRPHHGETNMLQLKDGAAIAPRVRLHGLSVAALALVLAAGAGAARAQSASANSAAATQADTGVYIGAGYVRARVNDVFGTENYGFRIDDNAWKAILGFRPIPFFAAEAEYNDLGHQSQELLGGTPPFGEYGHADARSVGLFGEGILPLGALDLYAKAGGARWTLSGNLQGPDSTLFALDRSGTSFAWGAGAQVHWGPAGLRLEYEHFQMPDTDGARLLSVSVLFTF
jgi:OmpA-like transmembrane domain